MSRTVKELHDHFKEMLDKGYGDALVDFCVIPEDGEDAIDVDLDSSCVADDTDCETTIIHALLHEYPHDNKLTFEE